MSRTATLTVAGCQDQAARRQRVRRRLRRQLPRVRRRSRLPDRRRLREPGLQREQGVRGPDLHRRRRQRRRIRDRLRRHVLVRPVRARPRLRLRRRLRRRNQLLPGAGREDLFARLLRQLPGRRSHRDDVRRGRQRDRPERRLSAERFELLRERVRVRVGAVALFAERLHGREPRPRQLQPVRHDLRLVVRRLGVRRGRLGERRRGRRHGRARLRLRPPAGWSGVLLGLPVRRQRRRAGPVRDADPGRRADRRRRAPLVQHPLVRPAARRAGALLGAQLRR